MEEEKRWIAVPTWRIPERLERWHSLIKYLKYKTKDLQKVCYVPHHKVGWAWWTCSRVIFPLQEKSQLEVQGYWNLTPERGWLSTHAVRITWYSRNFWTDVTPDCADILLHSTYFPCFTAGEVRRAIRGEQLLSCCRFPRAHKTQVPSLQYLALRVVSYVRSQRENPTWKQWRRDNRRSLRMAKQNSRGDKQRGSKPPTKGVDFPGLAKVLGILA
ncbi:vif protein [Simian immunodeficiency virus]|uniref:Virion infectivity factor n=1 Tax=Simian immunodeficiency virus TaxID=11723 RepID=Q04249_SIV|nr:vif protein [Simian immunodeficiency virus]AAV69859.1 Vif protein [SIV vector pCLN8]